MRRWTKRYLTATTTMSIDRSSHSNESEFSAGAVEGFWVTTWHSRARLANWDLALSGVLAAAGGIFLSTKTLEAQLQPLLLAEFGLIGALLGLVIAGLAIVIGFLSREYAVVVMRSAGGSSAEFWPFWFVSALAATAIICAGVGLVVAHQWSFLVRETFIVSSFFSLYAVLASVNLVATVKAQGETRALLLAREWERERKLKD